MHARTCGASASCSTRWLLATHRSRESTRSDTIVSILEREPAPLARLAPETPAELERIVTKALTKNTEERYQTVKDMAIDLRRLRRRQEVEAEMERSAAADASSSGAAAKASEQTAVASAQEPAGRADRSGRNSDRDIEH